MCAARLPDLPGRGDGWTGRCAESHCVPFRFEVTPRSHMGPERAGRVPPALPPCAPRAGARLRSGVRVSGPNYRSQAGP
jgi:hypothetical protein